MDSFGRIDFKCCQPYIQTMLSMAFGGRSHHNLFLKSDEAVTLAEH